MASFSFPCSGLFCSVVLDVRIAVARGVSFWGIGVVPYFKMVKEKTAEFADTPDAQCTKAPVLTSKKTIPHFNEEKRGFLTY